MWVHVIYSTHRQAPQRKRLTVPRFPGLTSPPTTPSEDNKASRGRSWPQSGDPEGRASLGSPGLGPQCPLLTKGEWSGGRGEAAPVPGLLLPVSAGLSRAALEGSQPPSRHLTCPLCSDRGAMGRGMCSLSSQTRQGPHPKVSQGPVTGLKDLLLRLRPGCHLALH